jgi:segregation and condensation protein B
VSDAEAGPQTKAERGNAHGNGHANANARETQQALDITAADPQTAAAAIEALLFASGQAETAANLAGALGWSVSDVRRGLDELRRRLAEQRSGLALQATGETWRLVSAPVYGAAVARLLGLERTQRLSPAALETLALIAYRQPVTRGDIEAVRGVDPSGVLATLVGRELVEPIGRRAGPGNPVEYGTTEQFLQLFGLASLEDLPHIDEGDADADQASAEALSAAGAEVARAASTLS